MGIIDVINAGIEFKDFSIKDINLEIQKGMITAVEGHNGAGKTTFLKMILGMYPKMKGRIMVDGVDSVKNREQMLNKVGFVSEERSFFKEYSAADNGKIYKKYYEKWDDERFKELLKRMNVSQNTKVGDMSKGNFIRFQTAFALASHPEVLMLDEPTAGLDPVFRVDYIKILQEVVAEDEVTVLISTHMTGDINKIADYIIDVKDGNFSMRENI